MPKVKALGTSLSYLPTYDSANAVTVVGSLTSIGEISPTSDEIDVTTLDSAGYKEFIQGLKDAGELPLKGFHNTDSTGQATMRTLFASGALGYFWVTFPDQTVVAFSAYVKTHTVGAAEVNGAVGFGCSLRISGKVQVITIADAVPQSKAVNATATLVSTASALEGTPTYQWKTCTNLAYAGAANVSGGSGGTTASYTTPALTPAGTKYYFCVITVAGYRPINSAIHQIVVA